MHPVDGDLTGSHWTSARRTPDVPAVIIRKGETGRFDVVEVGIVPTGIDQKGRIVADGTRQPRPFYPTAQEGLDFRVGSHRQVVSLGHLEEVEMPDEVRELLPERPLGAVFVDADGNLTEVLAGTAKAALASSRGADVRATVKAPAVAERTFPPQESGAATVQSGLVTEDGTAVLERVVTTNNGHVQRQEDAPVSA